MKLFAGRGYETPHLAKALLLLFQTFTIKVEGSRRADWDPFVYVMRRKRLRFHPVKAERAWRAGKFAFLMTPRPHAARSLT